MKNEGLISTLQHIGIITIILGVVVGIFLLVQFSQEGMFSSGKLTFTELCISVCVAFYHLIFGVLCLGIAQMLEEVSHYEKASVSQRESGVSKSIFITTCPKCGKHYPGDLHGQFCESCGEKL